MKRARPAALLSAAALLAGCGGPSGEELAERRQQLKTASQAYAALGVAQLRDDPEAMALAGRLFSSYCAECHGDGGHGTRGVPDLTTGLLTYGTSAASIRATITGGRYATMPAMGRDLGEVELGQVVAYVESFGSDGPLDDYEQRGRALYDEHCAECHGPRGRGIAAQGTPSLADDKWQHGGSMMNIRLAVTRGVESRCPAHEGELTAAETELLTAFVLELRGASTGEN